MKQDLYNKFLNNNCTEEELKIFLNDLDNDLFAVKTKHLGRKEWFKSLKSEEELLSDNESSLLLDKIHHQININSSKNQNKRKLNKQIHKLLHVITKIAAFLLLPLLVLYIYTVKNNQYESLQYAHLATDSIEIVAPIGNKTIVNLSDGSLVYLNHGSKIKYPQQFNSKTREVILIGEGYFEVAHNPDVPFIVKTKQMDVEALGTEFNVLAYPEDDIIEATLVNGKINVEGKDKDGDIKYVQAMDPNQHLSYNTNTGKTKVIKGQIEKYISWKDGKLVFENESIVEITERLSRWYNVDFEFEDEEIKDYTFTVTFDNETLPQVLEYMKIAVPIDHKTLARKKLQDGTLSKQTIILSKI